MIKEEPLELQKGVEELREGLYRVATPVPFPEKFTCGYVGRNEAHGAVSYTLLDPGYHTLGNEEIWQASLQRIGAKPSQIDSIYVTHFHPDHLGAAGWMQQWSGAPVYVLQQEIDPARAAVAGVPWGSYGTQSLGRWFTALGVSMQDEQMSKALLHMNDTRVPMFKPLPTLTPVRSGTQIPFAGTEAIILWAPGHTPGQLNLYLPQTHELFSGDHILPKITPNVSRLPGGLLNPLASYMENLRQLLMLPLGTIYPAHGKVLEEGVRRVIELYDHHIERAQLAAECAQDGRNVFDITIDLFSYRQLKVWDYPLALGEALAHLEYMVSQNRVDRLIDGKPTLPETRLESVLLDVPEAEMPTLRYRSR